MSDGVFLSYQSYPYYLEEGRLYTVHIDGLVLWFRDVVGEAEARVLRRTIPITREEAVKLAWDELRQKGESERTRGQEPRQES